MTLDQNVIGIDVSKGWLDIFDARSGRLSRLDNQPAVLAGWVAELDRDRLVVFEATGHYDRALRRALDTVGIGRVRVNPQRARDFARSIGQVAKTDQLDARMLASMGRALELGPDTPGEQSREQLADLARRRDQLVDMRAQEANHAEGADPLALESIAAHRQWLDDQIKTFQARIEALIAQTPDLAADNVLMRSMPGIGPVGANTMLSLLPELGRCSHRAIAALAGVAPINQDTGKTRGTRHIGNGRRRVRTALYMAALNASRCCPRFRAAYQALRQKGKSAKLALIAIARKIVVTLNAMIRDKRPFTA